MTGRKILLVDDDPDIRDAITVILEAQGYEVITANNGLECFDMLSNEKPGLLILDLLMPKMDGFEVFKELKSQKWAEFHTMPVIILTSVREEASLRRYKLETGHTLDTDDYIEKPIVPDVLIRSVNKHLAPEQ
jgi:two-component system, OmpR family, alkaline phosphatase synthesis response regulator PhoP